MEARGERQGSVTDPDNRARPKRPQVAVGYNVQVAVAAQPHLMVAHEVHHAIPDVESLRRLAIQAQEPLGVAPGDVVAEMGASHGEAINAWKAAGLEPYVATPLTSAPIKLGRSGNELVIYEPEYVYDRCPAGPILPCRVDTVERGDLYAT
jgi:hypothetical protein